MEEETLRNNHEHATGVALVLLQPVDVNVSHGAVARSSSLSLFGSISKLTKVLRLLVCGRSYLNNLSLKIALPARVNKVLREFAGKDLVNCYEVV